MSDDDIQKSIREALQGIISAEKALVTEMFEATDHEAEERRTKLKPVIAALEALKLEVPPNSDVDISTGPNGASVKMSSSSSRHTLRISTNRASSGISRDFPGNTHYEIEESLYYSFDPSGTNEKRHTFEAPDEVLRFVMNAVGKHLGSNEAVKERLAKSRRSSE